MEYILPILQYTLYAVAVFVLLNIGGLLLIMVSTAICTPSSVGKVFSDLSAIRQRDPAAEGWIAALFYPGFWALVMHRLAAHPLYRVGLRTPARLVNFFARFLTGADIHPGAQLGKSLFIDHAHGVVIGETAIVGENVTILHQVTLGGTGKDHGKRHPTIEAGVLLSAGSKVLGNITIGRDSKIGAGSVVVKEIPPGSTVVGIPGRVVATGGMKLPSQLMDQTNLPDPVVGKILELQNELREWEKRVEDTKSQAQPNGNRKDVLAEIVEHKKTEVAAAKAKLSYEALRAEPGKRGEARSFYQALKRPGISLIAEVKKASPSGGVLRADFDPVHIAQVYEAQTASALSILTDEKYFQGSLDYLGLVRPNVKIPILRKDFIIDEYQILQAHRAGADAILLIAACLDDAQLKGYREVAEGLGLDSLLEVHDEEEMARALKSGTKILGINNRNLKTLKTNLDTTFTLLGKLAPADRERLVVVSESGISKPEHIHALGEAKVNAVLIGETFMRAPDIGVKVREIMGLDDWAI